jgi:hypothetical protein
VGCIEIGRLPIARYAVKAQCRDGSRALISLAVSRLHAVRLARRFRDVELARQRRLNRADRRNGDGFAAVFIEEWIGTVLEGQWERLSEREGGCYYSFHNDRHCRKSDESSSELAA